MQETDLETATRIGRKLSHKKNEFTEAYHADADLRARAEADPRAVLVERGLDELAPSGAEVRIVANTGDTIHFILPPDPNAQMSDESLLNISGGFCGGISPPSTPPCHGVRTWGGCNTTPSCYIADGATRDDTSSGQ